MKCRITKCKAKCCYNVPFANGELTRYADKIVNPVLFSTEIHNGAQLAHIPWTVKVDFTLDEKLFVDRYAQAMMKNKCPFLRHDCTCNIYENRPEICRLFGEIDELKCQYRKK